MNPWMKQMPGYRSAYAAKRMHYLIPLTQLDPTLLRQYRAYLTSGLDTVRLMQLALTVESCDGFLPEEPVYGPVKNLLINTEGLVGVMDRHDLTDACFRAMDFVYRIGPKLRDQLDYYSQRRDTLAIVETAEPSYVIIAVNLREGVE